MATVSKPRPDVYQIITEQILDLLEQGVVPWKKPWRGGAAGQPKNLISKKAYRGINVFLLGIKAQSVGYDSAYWVTYKQAQAKGGNVKKGEKSSIVVFWKFFEVEKTTDTGKKYTDEIPMLRLYHVFNVAQCEGITAPDGPNSNPLEFDPPLEFSPLEQCERVVAEMPNSPPIYHDGHGRAFYRPMQDSVHMPERSKFLSVEDYYSTLFHELTHSTAHESRLNRKSDKAQSAAFGSRDHGKEELVAEMGAAFLCGLTGIEPRTIENSAAYIDGWRRSIKGYKNWSSRPLAQPREPPTTSPGKGVSDMMLLTQQIRKQLPPLYSREENPAGQAVAVVKFFTPWANWTWYATEYDGEDLFFGLVDGHCKELGYFSLSELQSVKGSWGLAIERDRHWNPTPLEQIAPELFDTEGGE